MKSHMYQLVSAVLLMAVLASCSGRASEPTTTMPTTASAGAATTAATTTTTVPASSTTAASTLGGIRYGDYLEQREEERASKKAEEDAAEELEEQRRLEELTVIDNEICLVRYSGEMETKSDQIKIGVYLENRSEDTNCEFRVLRASINGIEVDAYMSATVKPGKKANDEISLDIDILKKFGFTDYTSFEIELEVRDSEDWLADPFIKETIFAYKEGTLETEVFALNENLDFITLVDNDYATITVVGEEEDKIRGYVVWLYIQNKTENDLAIFEDKASVNGYMIDPLLSQDVLPGKAAFARMSWDQDDLDDNDIAVIEEIEIDIRCRSNDNWLDGDLFYETVTFTL